MQMQVSRNRGKRFVLFLVSFVFVLCAAYWLAFRLQAFGYVTASWWLKDLYLYKEWLAEQQPPPRILVLGGSGALFGVDSTALFEATGLPTVNLSAHAYLNLDFLIETVKPHIRDGDLIVLPLEHYYFFAPGQRHFWFISNMLAWGWESYLDRISLSERFEFLRAVPPRRIVQGLWGLGRELPLAESDRVIALVSQAGRHREWQGYGYKSLTDTGEYSVDLPVAEKVLEEFESGRSYLLASPSAAFIEKFKELERVAAAANARVMLTWPATIRNHRFDMSNEQHLAQLEDRFLAPLQRAGVTVHCSPGLFNYDVRFFFDTRYHLNRSGRVLNSETLAMCVNRFLSGSAPLPTHEAVSFVKAREAVLINELENENQPSPN